LRRANFLELSVILLDDVIVYQLENYRASYESLRTNAAFMKQDAPWVPFMFRQLPKFVSARLHNLVFNGTYYELFPSMELTS